METTQHPPKKNWLNILFLSLTPVIGVFGTAAYAVVNGVRWWEPVLFLTLFSLVSFQPSTRLRWNEISVAVPTGKDATSAVGTHSSSLRVLGGKSR